MKRDWRVLGAACLLGACANGQDSMSSEKPGADELEVAGAPTKAGDISDSAEPAPAPIEPGVGMQRLVDLAKRDLGGRLGLDAADIETVQTDYVTWRDSSLGCPRPGHEAMQVLSNGTRIRLKAGAAVYEYHSGERRAPFLCKNPASDEPMPYAPGEA